MVGILGLGEYSTSHYISRLNQLYQQRYGGYSTFPFKLLNVDFNLINPYLPDQFDLIIPTLVNNLNELDNLGVSSILIPNITIHEAIDLSNLSQSIRDKIIHPKKLLKDKLELHKDKKILVLGSAYTMNSTYLLNNIAINEIKDSSNLVESVDSIRREIFYTKVVNQLNTSKIQSILSANLEVCVVIACTELSIVNARLPKLANVIDLVEEQFHHIFNSP